MSTKSPVSGFTVPWCRFVSHWQDEKSPAYSLCCDPAAGFWAAGLWPEYGSVPPNPVPSLPKQPGTTPQITGTNTLMRNRTNHCPWSLHLGSSQISYYSICAYLSWAPAEGSRPMVNHYPPLLTWHCFQSGTCNEMIDKYSNTGFLNLIKRLNFTIGF